MQASNVKNIELYNKSEHENSVIPNTLFKDYSILTKKRRYVIYIED